MYSVGEALWAVPVPFLSRFGRLPFVRPSFLSHGSVANFHSFRPFLMEIDMRERLRKFFQVRSPGRICIGWECFV